MSPATVGFIGCHDQQFPQALAERVLAARGLQLADQAGMPPQLQAHSGADLDRDQGQLVQMRPLGVAEARTGELGQRLAAPQARPGQLR
jgi:hypothetical protein